VTVKQVKLLGNDEITTIPRYIHEKEPDYFMVNTYNIKRKKDL